MHSHLHYRITKCTLIAQLANSEQEVGRGHLSVSLVAILSMQRKRWEQVKWWMMVAVNESRWIREWLWNVTSIKCQVALFDWRQHCPVRLSALFQYIQFVHCDLQESQQVFFSGHLYHLKPLWSTARCLYEKQISKLSAWWICLYFTALWLCRSDISYSDVSKLGEKVETSGFFWDACVFVAVY